MKHLLSRGKFSNIPKIDFMTRFKKLHGRRRQFVPKPLPSGVPETRKSGFINLTLQQASQKRNIKKKLSCPNDKLI